GQSLTWPLGGQRQGQRLASPGRRGMTAREVLARLQELGNVEAARFLQGFFKTGPGQYGEGDRFLGIKVPPLRKLAREFRSLPLEEAGQLLCSNFHEARLLALLILVRAFASGDEAAREA